MSDSQEAKRERRAQAAAESLRSAAGGRMWNADDFETAANWGLDPASLFVPGDTFKLSGIQDYKALGFANTSPDPQLGLDQYLGSRGEDLQSFAKRTGGLPLRFNDDGTATYDPSAQTQIFTFEGKSEWWETAVPIAFAALATAGLTGYLPGTESVFGAAEAGGLGALNSFDTGAMAEILGTNVASSGVTTGASLLAENSFDTGAMQAVLERTGSTLTIPAGTSAIADVFKTGASVASSVGTIVQSGAVLDRAINGADPMPIASSPASNPLILNFGAQDMATKTATQPSSTPAAAPMNLQSLLPIAVLVVAVLALSGEIKGE